MAGWIYQITHHDAAPKKIKGKMYPQYCYIVDCWWLLKSLIDVSVLLYWLLMTIEMLNGCYSITILLVGVDWWKAWWLMQYWHTTKMLMIDFMLDDCLIWWLLSIIILLFMGCMFASWSMIDWVCINNDTPIIIVTYYFSIRILVMMSMFQHLYADYVDNALAWVMVESLALTRWWWLLMLSLSLHRYCR